MLPIDVATMNDCSNTYLLQIWIPPAALLVASAPTQPVQDENAEPAQAAASEQW